MAITDKDQQARLQTTHDVINYGKEQNDQATVQAGMDAQSKVLADNGIVYPNGNPAANVAPGTPLPKSWGGSGISGSGGGTGSGGGSSTTPSSGKAASAVSGMSSLAAQQNKIAQQQAKKQVDHAVQQGVNELTRAEADAQEQFQTQQNQVDIDEAKALDNQALYAEARGDRGGIGQAQYGQIQATALNNRRAINTARTKLATDTQRQIADLRAQGEFQKADAILQLTQTYLGQLMDLQKWGAEFSMQEAQFNAQLEQWDKEYALKLSEITGEYGGKPTLAVLQHLAEVGIATAQAGGQPTEQQLGAMAQLYGYGQSDVDAWNTTYQDSVTATQQKEAEERCEKYVSAGIAPDPEDARMAGWSDRYINARLNDYKLKNTKNSSGGGDKPADTTSLFDQMHAKKLATESEVVNYLMSFKKFKQNDAETLFSQYTEWLKGQSAKEITAKNGKDYAYCMDAVGLMLGTGEPKTQLAEVVNWMEDISLNADVSTQGWDNIIAHVEKRTGVPFEQWPR